MAKDHRNWWSFFVGLMGNFAQKVSTCARFFVITPVRTVGDACPYNKIGGSKPPPYDLTIAG